MTVPEFSRPYPVDRIKAIETVETVEAKDTERHRLAERLGLVSIDCFKASLLLRRELDVIRVSGRLEADIVQTCVVTIEPFPSHVEDSFTADFSERASQKGDEIVLDLDHEPPEPIVGGIIDIGELASQFLALALDPYPRAPGVELEQVWSGADDVNPSPFAAVAKLKRRTSR